MVSKKVALSIVALLAILGILTFQGVTLQNLRNRGVIEGNIEEMVRWVIPKVENIRSLKFKIEPEIRVVERKWVLEKWGPSTYSDEISYWEDLYKLTLLVDEEYNYTRSVEAYTASWIAAASGNTIYIIKDNFSLDLGTSLRVLAHELMHILQYQLFEEKSPKSFDEELAFSALIEGDADLVANTFAEEQGLKYTRITTLPLHDPPLALKYFPYVYGIIFVKELYKIGGWELVNNAYEDLPKSTEQIIHPEKFLEGEAPVNVNITIPRGYEVGHSDVLGEFYIYVLVATRTNETLASKVAEGWAGDRAVLLYNSTHKLLVWKICWDTYEDCEEFYDAYIYILKILGWEERYSKDNAKSYIMGDKTFTIKMCWNSVEIISTSKIES